MFNCHAHPGLYTKNALVCTARVDEISKLTQFPYRSLGSLPGFNTDFSIIENWAEKEAFIGEIGVDKRFDNKELQFSVLSDILSIAEEHNNIVTFHQVGWTDEFLNTVFSFHLRGFIIHGFTGSYEIYNEVGKHGGLVSLSPLAEKTKFFSTLKERGITYPFLTETDSETGIEEIKTLKTWNDKLSLIFDRDIEKEVEDTFFSYISNCPLLGQNQ